MTAISLTNRSVLAYANNTTTTEAAGKSAPVAAKTTAAKIQAPKATDSFEAVPNSKPAKSGAAGKSSTGISATTKTWIEQEKAAYQANLKKMAIGDQGNQNACGTTSMANALSFFGLPFNNATDFKFIDKTIRPWTAGAGLATAPGDIVKLAKKLGMQAGEYSKCSLEDVARELRDGRTITVITNYVSPRAPGGGAGVHYVNIIGVERDPQNGQITKVHVRNPWGRGFQDEVIGAKEFMKMWTNVRANGKAQGNAEDLLLAVPICDRTMIVVAEPGAKKLKKPTVEQQIANSNINVTLNGVNGIAAGVDNIKGGNVVSGVGQVSGSTVNAVVGGVCFIVGNLVGSNVEQGGDKLIKVGSSWMKGDFFSKIGGAGAWLLGGILKSDGWLLSSSSNAISSLTGSLTSILSDNGFKGSARSTIVMAINNNSKAATVMKSATTATKAAMFVTVVNKGKATAAEQKAALQILQAAKSGGDLSALVKQLGGKSAVQKMFTGANLTAANKLLATIK